MKFIGLLFVAFLAFAPAPSFAQTAAPPAGGPVAIGQAAAQVDQAGKVAIVVAPPVADTTVSFGTLGAQLLGWVSAVFVPVLGAFLTKWVMAMAKKAGVEASQAMSDKLDAIIENGLHSAASAGQKDLTGKLNVDVKNDVIAKAVIYAQNHAVETIKGLSGRDPNDLSTIEVLQARAAKILSNIGPDAVLAPAPVAADLAPLPGTTGTTAEPPKAA